MSDHKISKYFSVFLYVPKDWESTDFVAKNEKIKYGNGKHGAGELRFAEPFFGQL